MSTKSNNQLGLVENKGIRNQRNYPQLLAPNLGKVEKSEDSNSIYH